ncbi:MAG: hypothetical protein ACTIJ6_02450 [Leucobacter sp.]
MSTNAPDKLHASYSSTEARTSWRDIMDSSARGLPVTIRRQDTVTAVTDAERLRQYFFKTLEPHTMTYVEDGVHSLVLDGRGFTAEGSTLDAAIEDMVLQLREYQDDWALHYSSAPNHRSNWPLTMLLSMSTDTQLKDWLINGGE